MTDKEAKSSFSKEEGVGALTLWVAIILTPLVCIWVFRSEILFHSSDLASNALALAAVYVLLTLLALRSFLRGLNRNRILLIYTAVVGTVGISTMGMVQFLITSLVAPFWYSTRENRWEELTGLIPLWAAPRAPHVVRGFFEGHSSLYDQGIWQAWLIPATIWGIFIAVLLITQYCIAHLMYPRWANQERLTFPIAQFPLTLTERSTSTPWALILGASSAIAIQGVNALHVAVPAIPQLNVLPVEVGSKLPPPWNGCGVLWITFYPCIIGLSALIPTNILFSGVFFFVLTKVENVAAHHFALGASTGLGTSFPYPIEQAQGASLTLALIVLWTARGILRRSFHDRTNRIVWVVLALSSFVLVSFGSALGLRPLVSLLFFTIFLLFMIGAGWVRAAVGLVWNPGNDVSWWSRAFGGNAAPLGEGVGTAYLRWFSYGDFRAHALPTYVDTMRLSQSVGISRRNLVTVLALGSILSIVASLWVALDVYYRYGAATALTDPWRNYQGRQAFVVLQSQINGLSPRPALPQMEAAVFGSSVVLFLQSATTRLLWWPLHPAGFVVAQAGCLEWLWLPMAIAGVAKTIILRVGGLKFYRRALPFFIGLVLGDYAISAFLTILGRLLHAPMYKPFPI